MARGPHCTAALRYPQSTSNLNRYGPPHGVLTADVMLRIAHASASCHLAPSASQPSAPNDWQVLGLQLAEPGSVSTRLAKGRRRRIFQRPRWCLYIGAALSTKLARIRPLLCPRRRRASCLRQHLRRFLSSYVDQREEPAVRRCSSTTSPA